MSQAELASAAGFKHQSAIGNLESRATGRGGFSLPAIARCLDVPVEWLLDGPDGPTPAGAQAPSDSPQPIATSQVTKVTDIDRAIHILRRLPKSAVTEALQFIQFLETKSVPSTAGADLPISDSAPPKRARR